MFIASILALTVGAAPMQVAATRFTIKRVFLQRPEALLDSAVRELAGWGVGVITPARATEQLGSKRSAELLACAEPVEQCAMELSQALGVVGVLKGAVARESSSGGYQVTLQVLSASDGRALTTFFEGGVDEGNLADVVAKGARVVGGQLTGKGVERLSGEPIVVATRTSPLLRKIGWGALAGTVVAGAFGVGAAVRRMQILNAPRPDPNVAVAGLLERLLSQAEEARVTSVVMFVGCGAAAVTASVLLALGFTPTRVTPTLTPGPGGMQLGFGGTF